MGNRTPAHHIAWLSIAALLSACNGDGPAASNKVVQIADYSVTATSISCHGGSAPDSVYWNVHMVNTTDSNVTVQTVGTSGVIIRSQVESTVGHVANTYDALPFNPMPMLLAANSGDRTLTVSMPTIHLCTVDAPMFWKDVYISLRVTTSSGQYVTSPATFKIHDP